MAEHRAADRLPEIKLDNRNDIKKHPDDTCMGITLSVDEPRDLQKELRPEIDSSANSPTKLADKVAPKPGRHPHLSCPSCARNYLTRVGCQGMAEHALSMIYIYPFRCRSCGCRFRKQEWGVRYRRQARN